MTINRYYDQLKPELKEILQQVNVDYDPIWHGPMNAEQLVDWLREKHPRAYHEYKSSIAMKRHVEVRNKNYGRRKRYGSSQR